MRLSIRTFKDFWITGDPKRRSRCLAIAICSMAVYGLIFSSFGWQSRKDAARQALGIGAAIMLLASFIGRRETQLPKSGSKIKKDVLVITASVLGVFLIGQGTFALQSRLTRQSLEDILEGKASKSELEKTARLLPLAANSGLVLPPPILTAAYRNASETGDSDAWNASLAIINYRSHFSPNPIPKNAPLRRIEPGFKFALSSGSDPGGIEVGHPMRGDLLHTYGDDVPIANAARLERVGSNLNSDHRYGPKIIVVNVGSIGLVIDEMWMKKVVVMHSKVIYKGGPLLLEQVYFIDCQFQMNSVPPARKVGMALIADMPASVEIKQPEVRALSMRDQVIPASIAGVTRHVALSVAQ